MLRGLLIGLAVLFGLAWIAVALDGGSPRKQEPRTPENPANVEPLALTITAHQLVQAQLKDPESAVFDYDLPRRTGLFCGTVRVRNSFGGYGSDIFYIMFPFGVVNSEQESQVRFKRLWDLYCVDRGSVTSQSISRNRFNDVILRAKSTDRAWMLGRIVAEGCVGRTAYYMGLDARKNIAFWSARCSNGSTYEVGIWPDDAPRVLECSILKRLHAGKCFQKIP